MWAAAQAGESQPAPTEALPQPKPSGKRSLLQESGTSKKQKREPKAQTKQCKRAGPPPFVPPRRVGADDAEAVAQRLEAARVPPLPATLPSQCFQF